MITLWYPCAGVGKIISNLLTCARFLSITAAKLGFQGVDKVPEPYQIIAYTDASVFMGTSGIGVLLKYPDREIEISEHAGPGVTVNQAELLAIERAIDETYGQTLIIFTDSKYAIQRLKAADTSNVKFNLNLILRIRDKLRARDNNTERVELKYCRAHSGLEGNMRADKLAKNARRNGGY